MGEQRPRKRSRQHFETHAMDLSVLWGPRHGTSKWYFSRDEIEHFSPSRMDGIDLEKESYLRASYCTFLQRLGMKLRVSQIPIGCAMVLCHRFYMRQSHAKNDWQTIATASLFLACKLEDVPCYLCGVVIAAYEIIYEWDPSATMRIHQRDFYHKVKELILLGERLLLDTIAFDLNIELPYKPLVAALNMMNTWPEVVTMAWNFVNDWLHTTLCLQYRPHVIAAASVHLAATFQNRRIGNGRDWWLDFGVPTKQLKEVIQEMRRRAQPPPSREFLWPVPQAVKPVPSARTYSFRGYHCQPQWHPGIW